mgnify:FL=1
MILPLQNIIFVAFSQSKFAFAHAGKVISAINFLSFLFLQLQIQQKWKLHRLKNTDIPINCLVNLVLM